MTDGGSGSALGTRFSYMSDNIVRASLEKKDEVKRTLAILKARGTAHDSVFTNWKSAWAGHVSNKGS